MGHFAAVRGPRQIVVGVGQRNAAPFYAAKLGTRILICTDVRMAEQEMFGALVDGLATAGVTAKVFDQSPPEVPIDAIEKAVALGRAFAPDMILGLGGGSCMDMAKMTALLLTHGGKPQDYYGEFKVPGRVLPVIAMPTTAGTGSEVTPVAVIADSERAMKVGISSPELIPEIAICDPELTLSCPPGLTAISGADAMTHAIEALMAGARNVTDDLTNKAVFVGKNSFSDHYALIAIAGIAQHLERAVNCGSDIDARAGMMWASTLAGLAFGTAGTAAAHALQYPLGALTHTAHGLGVACLLPYVMEYNRPACESALLQIADAMQVPNRDVTDGDRSDAAIAAVADLFSRIGVPKTVTELGLVADQLDWVADQAMAATRLVQNNPRPLDRAAMARIIQAARSGRRHDLRV